jgi:UDP-N-acetylglucosamine/UDP-N-acetylgalactosamine diphosphorylase
MTNWKQILQEANQKSLLTHYEGLDTSSKSLLENELHHLDFSRISKLFALTKQNDAIQNVAIEPFAYANWDAWQPQLAQYKQVGMELLAAGKCAVLLVAGGQGSRLGFEGPKGMYNIGLPSGNSLFALQAKRLLGLQEPCKAQIPWFIMTSPLNHAPTVAYFKAENYFGLAPEQVDFYPQNMLPALDTQGQILLETPVKPALVPDGNGGCFRVLKQSGVLEKWKQQGVEYVFVYSVDNALVRIADPVLFGFQAMHKYDATSKVIQKGYPEEKVGVFCMKDGKPAVIEYSDMSTEMIHAKNANGSLAYSASNIAVHSFSMQGIEKVLATDLPYHLAFKKVPYVNTKGEVVEPKEPNAWKFEQFMFDAFPMLGSLGGLEVLREEEFAPVKNASGKDSPQEARESILDLHTRWLSQAGVSVGAKRFEIDPCLAWRGEDVKATIDPRLLYPEL